MSVTGKNKVRLELRVSALTFYGSLDTKLLLIQLMHYEYNKYYKYFVISTHV